MKKLIVLPALLLAVASGQAAADQRGNAVAGALIGSAAGAVIGHHISGRDGAMVGGALGAATGVAVATSGRDSERRYADGDSDRDAYIYGDDDRYSHERVVYVQPEVRERVVYVQPEPVVIYRASPIVYHSRPVIVHRGRQVVYYDRDWDRRDRGWKHGHDKDDRKAWKHRRKHHDD